MFDNIGGKIKGLAKVICWIGIIASCIGGIIYWVAASELHAGFVGFLAGLGIIVGGSLMSWIGSFATYALGELVDNGAATIAQQEITNKELSSILLALQKSNQQPHYQTNSQGSISSSQTITTPPDSTQKIISVERELVGGKCDICNNHCTQINLCKIIDQWGIIHHKLICKNCQKRYTYNSIRSTQTFSTEAIEPNEDKLHLQTRIEKILSVGIERANARCELCNKKDTSVNVCAALDLQGTVRHIIICKDCQQKYNTPSDQ